MKYSVLVLTIAISVTVYGQSNDRFRNFQGLTAPGNAGDFFEAEGYDIVIQHQYYALDEKGISKIKKQYGAKEGSLRTDSVLHIQTLAGNQDYNGLTAKYCYYLIPSNPSITTVIGFVRLKTRDIELERYFVNAYQASAIPDFVYARPQIDSIDFVGRTIQLGPICHWMAPHNIQCPDRGQLNWAIFDDLKQAEDYRQIRLEMTKSKSMSDVRNEKWVRIKFEGVEVTALRTEVKIKLPKFVMAGSNRLIAYYVTAPVRGKYVTCVLSHYTDDIGAGKLPPLLAEVMELME